MATGANAISPRPISSRPHCDVDEGAIRPDACPPHDHRALVVVAGAWLAFSVVAAIHELIASGN